jgi:Cu/Ag efflux protein CusF
MLSSMFRIGCGAALDVAGLRRNARHKPELTRAEALLSTSSRFSISMRPHICGHGQSIKIDVAGDHLTVKHEAIPGFMSAMTMTYPVKDDRQLEARLARGARRRHSAHPS